MANRSAMYAAAGALVLCVCLCIGLIGIGYGSGMLGSEGSTAGFSLPSFGSKPTPTPQDTPVPYQKSAKNDAGLRLTVTAFQRPLPAQDVSIPSGQELVLVTVRIENTRTTGGPIKYSLEDFRLVGASGDSFTPDQGSLTTEEMLKSGELAPGKSAKGDMIFYVYSDVRDLLLNWESADGSVRQFALGRK